MISFSVGRDSSESDVDFDWEVRRCEESDEYVAFDCASEECSRCGGDSDNWSDNEMPNNDGKLSASRRLGGSWLRSSSTDANTAPGSSSFGSKVSDSGHHTQRPPLVDGFGPEPVGSHSLPWVLLGAEVSVQDSEAIGKCDEQSMG